MEIVPNPQPEVNCPKCDARLRGSPEEFLELENCPACGVKLKTKIIRKITCPRCGGWVMPDADCCTVCGKNLRQSLIDACVNAVGCAIAFWTVSIILILLYSWLTGK